MAEKQQTQELAKPEKRLMEVHVVVNPPSYAYGWGRDPEKIARSLEQWARDLNDFIRDHRSQDSLDLEVVRNIQEVCSLCGRPWEIMLPDDDCPQTTCAWCGEQVDPSATTKGARDADQS